MGIILLTVTKYTAFRTLQNFGPISKEVDYTIIAINDVFDYFNVRDKSIDINPGTEVKIIIRPSIQSSSDAFKALGQNSKHIWFG